MTDRDEDNSEFRVVDKRRFTEAGDVRESLHKEEVVQTRVSPAESGQSDRFKTSAVPKDAAIQQDSEDTETVDFPSFIVSLATQALAFLGEIPNPENAERSVNIPAARQVIDIVAMLEEKTKGNLNNDESKLVTEVLTSLRMAFVATVRK